MSWISIILNMCPLKIHFHVTASQCICYLEVSIYHRFYSEVCDLLTYLRSNLIRLFGSLLEGKDVTSWFTLQVDSWNLGSG